MKQFSIILLLVFTRCLAAQSADSIPLLTPAQMHEDLAFFYNEIERTHPRSNEVHTSFEL
jgi:hypothetical protein